MSIQSAGKFLLVSLISLAVFSLIYFFYPNRNMQLAVLNLLYLALLLTIISVITYIIVRIKRRHDY